MMEDRCRQKANREINIEVYSLAIQEWLSSPPSMNVLQKLGRSVAADIRQVTPQHVVTLRPMINKLLSAGLSNGVLQSCKVKEASYRVFMRNIQCCGAHGVDYCVDKFAMHVSCVMQLLREATWEESNASPFGGYKRTGGFRKKARSQ